jgi:hypothetical protein
LDEHDNLWIACPATQSDRAQRALKLRCRSNGRHWIRTNDFHRVRMARKAENHTPLTLASLLFVFYQHLARPVRLSLGKLAVKAATYRLSTT